MAISLQPKFFESNQTHLTTVATKEAQALFSRRNSVRKSGLIINHSKYDLRIWFGSVLPTKKSDWLVIPSRANCDIPLFFIGEIHGFWDGDDTKTAQIYEFYGD
jgi:hypothetical protein